MSEKFITYYRVSTQRQGESGLGLEAQQAAVEAFTRGVGVAASYTEIESGKRADRPQLAAAIEHAKRVGARLLVAKLDRLARNVAFTSRLMEDGVKFTACDNPGATELVIHILAAVAQNEARQISERTKAALEAAKRRGVQLGGYRGTLPANVDIDAARAAALVKSRGNAIEHANRVKPMLDAFKAQGLSATAIADALTKARVPTSRGSTVWQTVQVQRLLARAA